MASGKTGAVQVYYHRRVLPNDLQLALGRREIVRSLRTKDCGEAKRLCAIEDVRFNEWVCATRAELAKTRQIASANGPTITQAQADAMEEHAREASAFFAQLYPNDEDGQPYAVWLVERERRDRATDAAHFEQERRAATLPLLDLFDQYASQPNSRAETVKQFRAVVEHFIAFLGHANALRVRRADVVKWRDHLRGELGPRGKPRSAKTINDTYLSVVGTVFAYGVDRLLVAENPAKDVKRLPSDKRPILRDRDFTAAEQRLILSATLAAPPARMAPHNAAARRWVPWLCAYTGARVNEITQLRGQDVKEIDGVWTIHITPEAGTTKTQRARTVPLHEHLIEQGFLAVVGNTTGPLFYEPLSRRKSDGRPQYKKVGMKLAEWVKSLGIPDGVAPNHGWRHTFRTLAREAEIPEEAADYIVGHAGRTQGRRYGTHNLPALSRELAKVPRFCVE